MNLPRLLLANCLVLGVLFAQNAASADAPMQLTAKTARPSNSGTVGVDSLAGVDANHNGVRDDLEEAIVRDFGRDARRLRAVSNIVISLQAAIMAGTASESLRAHSMTLVSSECLAALGAMGPEERNKLEKLFEAIVDTPPRTAAAEAHQQRIADEFFAVNRQPVWGAHCETRADLLQAGSGPFMPRRQ